MNLDQLAVDGFARRYEYPDRVVFAADFGPTSSPSVDVLDDTLIIVTEDGRQRELALPDGKVRAFNRHGIVTIEVSQ